MTDKEIEQSVAELVQEIGLENFTVKGKTLAHWFAICENYIQRLKAENEQIRKETAGEILQDLYDTLNEDTKSDLFDLAFAATNIRTAIFLKANKYGIEVDK